MLLDRSTPPLAGLEVHGTLVFDDDYLTLTSDWVMVHGKLQIGAADKPFSKRARIELTGTDPSQNVMGMGPKVLGVMGGTLEVHGEERTGWTRLGATAPKGATTLTLDRDPGWRAGDRIAISSTDYATDQAEEATITSVSGATVTLSRPLDYEHFGARQTVDGRTVDERAEVALLSRNVRIEGEESSSADGFGGQVMVMNGGVARIEGAELTRMGQKAVLRRYPIHFHMLGDVGGGSYLEDSSLHHTYNRCVTVHGTNRLRIAGNTCFDHIGHGYFFEDGAEVDNARGQPGLSHQTSAVGPATPTERRRRRHLLDHEPRQHREGKCRRRIRGLRLLVRPSRAPDWALGEPRHLAATHSARRVRRQRRPLERGRRAARRPRSAAGRNQRDHLLRPARQPGAARRGRSRLLTRRGSLHRTDGVQEPPPRGLAARREPPRERRRPRRQRDRRDVRLRREPALGVARRRGDGQQGHASSWEVSVGRVGVDGRSLPRPWERDFPIRGFEFYDGRVGTESTTFANYAPNALREASGLGFLLADAFGLHPRNYAAGARFVDAKRVYMPDPVPGKDGDASAVFVDTDGSVTGTPKAVVAANNPFLADPTCLGRSDALRADWNAYVCAPTDYGSLSVGTGDGDPADIKPLRLTRLDDAKVQTLWGATSDDTTAESTILPNREYGVEYNGGTPQKLRFVLYRGSAKWALLRVAYPVPPKVTKYGCDLAGTSWCRGGAATSLADLRSKDRSSFWYDAGGRQLYVKVYATDPGNPGRAIDWEELKVEPAPAG